MITTLSSSSSRSYHTVASSLRASPPRAFPHPTPPQEAMAKDYRQLLEGVASATNEAEAVLALSKISTDKLGRHFILGLGHEETGLCINVLDRGITERALEPAEMRAFLVTLRGLAGYHGRLPDRVMITEKIKDLDDIHTFGVFGDVRAGTHNGLRVAVKTARVLWSEDLERIRKRFYREAVLWSALSHPNIMELVGVQEDTESWEFATVLKWMEHRNIMEFIRVNHSNRLELLHGASQGLEYLHRANLTHGDLRGSNILVSDGPSPRACLTDFDFITTILEPGRKFLYAAESAGGAMQFMSPELLELSIIDEEQAISTPQADIYAFGSTIFQVLTGGVPFPRIRDSRVRYNVLRGERPGKPTNALSIGFSDSLWTFAQLCWQREVGLRPKIGDVVAHLREAATEWDRLMPPCSDFEQPVSDPKEFDQLFLSFPSDSAEYSPKYQTIELRTPWPQAPTQS